MEEIIEQLETTRSLVEEILADDQRARNSDLWLCLRVWQEKQNINIMIDYKDIPHMINPETIRRIRQHIQNTEERFLPEDPTVLTKRRIKEEAIRRYFRKDSWVYQEWQGRRFGIK